MRTLIYARFSSRLQNSRSIDDQVAVCRERAEREGWSVVDVFTDAAIGGGAGMAESQRPGLAALLARVEQGDIDQVLVDTSSRIARNQGDSHHFRDRINHWGARLFTLGDGEIDRFKGAFKGLLDEQQRVELRHNIKRGQLGTVRQGRSPAGIAYGYRTANRIDPSGRPVRGLREVDAEQAAIVVRIFGEIAKGDSPLAIIQRLNVEGVPGPRGERWRVSTIRPDWTRGNGLLINRLYTGELVHNRTSKVIEPVTRATRIRPNPESEWTIEPVPHLRIIDDELWQAVQLELARNRTATSPVRKRRPVHVLSGLGVCGTCGGGWNVINNGFWGCGARREGADCSNNRTISTESYERRVIDGLEQAMLDPELVAIYVKEYHEERARLATASRRAEAGLRQQLTASAARIDRLVAAVGDGGRDFPEIRDALTAARAERDEAEELLAEFAAAPVVALHPNVIADYRRLVANLHEALADPDIRAEAIPAIRSLIDRLVLSPNPTGRGVTIEIEGRLNAILALATGQPAPPPLSPKVERVKGIEPSS